MNQVYNGDVTIIAGEGTYGKLQGCTINGNLIINGVNGKGGTIYLVNHQSKGSTGNDGSIIVNEIAEHSLYLIGVYSNKLEIKDNNNARIVSKETAMPNRIVNVVVSTENSQANVELEGDFGVSRVEVQKPVNIKLAEDTRIKELVLVTENTKITTTEGDDLSSKIGKMVVDESIANNLPDELKTIVEDVDKDIKFLGDFLIKANEVITYEDNTSEEYLAKLQSAKDFFEVQQLFPLHDLYRNYSDASKLKVFKNFIDIIKYNEPENFPMLISLFNDSIYQNEVFEQCEKYRAYFKNADFYPIIDKEAAVGTDVTDMVIALMEGKEKNAEFKLTFTKGNEYLTLKDNKVYLNRLNETGKDALLYLEVKIASSKHFSITGFYVTLKSQP